MNKLKIVFLETSSLTDAVVIPPLDFPNEQVFYEDTVYDEAVSRAQDADIIIINKFKIDKNLIAQLPKLKIIGITATGVDNIDFAAIKPAGITVLNVRSYSVHTVPEHTISLMLALAHNIAAYSQAVKEGKWNRAKNFNLNHLPIRELNAKRLGIIGHGELGIAVGKIANAFGMEVFYLSRENKKSGLQYLDKHGLLSSCDYISLHCPLTDETRDLINKDELAIMKPSSFLINTARGGVVNEQALAEALLNKKIAGAGFDVASSEPLSDTNPLNKILHLDNFILTPHIAWSSEEAIHVLMEKLFTDLEQTVIKLD